MSPQCERVPETIKAQPTQWRLQRGGGNGHPGHAPQRAITGANIYFAPHPKAGPLDPLGPLAAVDFLFSLGFQGPAGRIGAPREGSGFRRTNQAPRRDGSGPARQLRTRRTNQGPAERIRAQGTDQGPAGRTRAPQCESGSHETDQGPVG